MFPSKRSGDRGTGDREPGASREHNAPPVTIIVLPSSAAESLTVVDRIKVGVSAPAPRIRTVPRTLLDWCDRHVIRATSNDTTLGYYKKLMWSVALLLVSVAVAATLALALLIGVMLLVGLPPMAATRTGCGIGIGITAGAWALRRARSKRS